MSINDYASEIESVIRSNPIILSYSLNIDKKTEDLAYISGKIDLRDGSILDFKEFAEQTQGGFVKLKYGYNYRIGPKVLFRYDNARIQEPSLSRPTPITNILRTANSSVPRKSTFLKY